MKWVVKKLTQLTCSEYAYLVPWRTVTCIACSLELCISCWSWELDSRLVDWSRREYLVMLARRIINHCLARCVPRVLVQWLNRERSESEASFSCLDVRAEARASQVSSGPLVRFSSSAAAAADVRGQTILAGQRFTDCCALVLRASRSIGSRPLEKAVAHARTIRDARSELECAECVLSAPVASARPPALRTRRQRRLRDTHMSKVLAGLPATRPSRLICTPIVYGHAGLLDHPSVLPSPLPLPSPLLSSRAPLLLLLLLLLLSHTRIPRSLPTQLLCFLFRPLTGLCSALSLPSASHSASNGCTQCTPHSSRHVPRLFTRSAHCATGLSLLEGALFYSTAVPCRWSSSYSSYSHGYLISSRALLGHSPQASPVGRGVALSLSVRSGDRESLIRTRSFAPRTVPRVPCWRANHEYSEDAFRTSLAIFPYISFLQLQSLFSLSLSRSL